MAIELRSRDERRKYDFYRLPRLAPQAGSPPPRPHRLPPNLRHLFQMAFPSQGEPVWQNTPISHPQLQVDARDLWGSGQLGAPWYFQTREPIVGTATLALEKQPGVRRRVLDLQGQRWGGQAQSPVCAVEGKRLIMRFHQKSSGKAVFKLSFFLFSNRNLPPSSIRHLITDPNI